MLVFLTVLDILGAFPALIAQLCGWEVFCVHGFDSLPFLFCVSTPLVGFVGVFLVVASVLLLLG